MNQADRIAQLEALAKNLPTHFPSTSLYVSGERYDTAQIQAMVTELVDAMTALADARARVKDAHLAFKKTQAQVGSFLKDLRTLIGASYSGKPSVLGDLGVAPKKERTPLSAEARATAEAKARATREARGTKGKKQRAAIHGTVTGVTITPVVIPDPSSSRAAPVPQAPPGSETPTASTARADLVHASGGP